MNNRFKFRVYDEDTKKMIYFDTFSVKRIWHEGSSFPQYELNSSPHYHKVSEFMQCTGLKDKNGNLIYEGDICEYEFEDIGKQKAIIYFNNKYASFLKKPLNDFQYAEINDCKVIGNIYEVD